jgi:hypothetical protein
MPHAALLVAALHWDPTIRGFLIIAAGVLLLPGSVYLLLATNTGARLGFILTAAGLSGWMFLLAVIWIVYGIGLKGNAPTWQIKEIVTGDLTGHAATPAVRNFPNGWKLVAPGDSSLAVAQSAADHFLTPAAAPAAGQTNPTPKFPPPFKVPADYVAIGGYSSGGNSYLFRIGSYKVEATIRHHHFFIKHQPHYFVIRVQKALPTVTLAGAPTTLPAPDVTQPIISVVMLRDVGSLRQPNVFIAIASLLVFVVCCWSLHRRDKEIIRRRALAAAPA